MTNKDDGFDLEEALDLAKLKKANANKGGRPPEAVVSSQNEIERFQAEIELELSQADETPVRSNEELLQFSYKILSKIQNVWFDELRTYKPGKTIIAKTNNGKAKISVTGLLPDQQKFIMDSIKACCAMIEVLKLDPATKNSPLFANTQQMVDQLYEGIPGLKVSGSI